MEEIVTVRSRVLLISAIDKKLRAKDKIRINNDIICMNIIKR